jgi:hypothetical protein
MHILFMVKQFTTSKTEHNPVSCEESKNGYVWISVPYSVALATSWGNFYFKFLTNTQSCILNFYEKKLCRDTRSFVLTLSAKAFAFRQGDTESYLMPTKWLM